MKQTFILLLVAFGMRGGFLTPSSAENPVESSPDAAAAATVSDSSGNLSSAPADEIPELRRMIQEKDREIERLGSDLALARKEMELCESELEFYRERLAIREPRIVWVNPEWNFVLVDHGGFPMIPGIRAYVHRGTNFVGSITITNVQETVSIAEINPADQVPGLAIQVGDDMFFPPRADAGSGDRKPSR